MNTPTNSSRVITKVANHNKIVFAFVIVAVIIAELFLWSEAKCHYSAAAGVHCHALFDVPHIHPFANH